MARWRNAVFGVTSHDARSATDFFGLPPNRVVEPGAQIEFQRSRLPTAALVRLAGAYTLCAEPTPPMPPMRPQL